MSRDSSDPSPADPARPDLAFAPKDAPLRDDVRRLGALVGEVIREQGGEALFARVESARRAAIDRREARTAGDPERAAEAERRLVAELASLEPHEAAALVRAFSSYFRVVNLAERIHRIRRRRDYLREEKVQRGSLRATVRELADRGLSRREAIDLLAEVVVEPVFTAHPTEATRRAILEKEQRIARRLVERLDPSRTPPEERRALARIRSDVTGAWQTVEQPRERPTVADEAGHVLFYLTDVIYRIVPPFYEDLQDALAAVYGDVDPGAEEDGSCRAALRFASWVGGDMDGNPNVSAETFLSTLRRHRSLALERYRREALRLAGDLTQGTERVEISDDLKSRTDDLAALFPATVEAVRPRHRGMRYRIFFRLVAARLEATAAGDERGYPGPDALCEDVESAAASLAAHRGRHAGRFAVERLRRRVDAFGFHLATLDLRQDALVHRRVVGELLGEEGWLERDSGERAARLRQALEEGVEPIPEGTAVDGDEEPSEVVRTLAVFRAAAVARREMGERAVGPFIISMAQAADDVLSVLWLARAAGLAAPGEPVPLDVAPLFETVGDLEAGPGVMEGLWRDPIYRAHLESRGRRQTVMIGYSDSGKDGGLAASRWALHRGQAALAAAAERAGVRLTVFHGRGGTVSRGGGKTHRAVLAAPRGSVDGHLRYTVQGETIATDFGLRGIALRTLSRTYGATALATAAERSPERRPGERDDRESRVWRSVMEEIAEASRRAYRDLVYEHPRFVAYFRAATPIDLIERMAIGSRPASRRSGEGVENLRAIPWIFAWTQSRHLLPGWYGVGTGLEKAAERHGAGLLAEMAAGWPFFATMLADLEMVLAKADLGVAERYAALAGEAGEEIFPILRAEHDRTIERVLAATGSSVLLEEDSALARSIRLRNPYVDPMSLLQLDLLPRWRDAGRPDGPLLEALLATVHGIAQGLQNTG